MKSVRIDMKGRRCGRLLVLSFCAPVGDGRAKWLCLCDCGKQVSVLGKHLRCGNTRSCGCIQREVVAHRSRTHGLSGSPTYMSWAAMKSRCGNPKQRSYENYGAKGVKVCERWIKSFAAFLADMGERPEGMTLDRINPFGDYKPSNCRWAGPTDQSRNTRGRAAIAILERLRVVRPNPPAMMCG